MFSLLIAGIVVGVSPESKGVSLTGIVKDSNDTPVAKAVVFIRTAAPRKGVGVLCPSCYADCVKQAVTDREGTFALTGLDPELVFRLLVVADGYIPIQSPNLADPRAGAVSFALTQHDLDTRDPARVFRGRVINENGKPVVGAVVSPFGVEKSGSAHFGKLKGIDALAVTNDMGEFRLGVSEAKITLFVGVSAPFMASRHFQSLRVDKLADLTLLEGVTVTGRIIKDGKPLSGGAIGLAQKERNVKTFVGPFQAASDDDGVFTIRNLPPDDTLTMYGVMSALRTQGAIPSGELRTGKSGATIKIGDLEVRPGYRLSGRVELSDGKAVPGATQVMVSRKEAWDSQQAVVDDNGKFVFEGLPAERYSLAVRVPGYHLSPRNASLDPLDPFSLIGSVGKDIQEIRLLLEPGAWPPIDNSIDQDCRVAEHNRRRDATLQGTPPARSKK